MDNFNLQQLGRHSFPHPSSEDTYILTSLDNVMFKMCPMFATNKNLFIEWLDVK